MSEKRFQVFVSSTFADLQDERQEVMHALLELDCIPSGMELFPAANETQWELIKRVIDDCDYYILIVGGRYGSLGPEGISFTEMEYRYAMAQQKPVIAFLHKEPGKIPVEKTETSEEGRKKLDEFRNLTKQKLVKYWNTAQDLGSVVSRSLVQLIKTTPAIGWIRANELPDKDATQELLQLRRRVEQLQEELNKARRSAPPGSEMLASGDEQFEVHYSFEARNSGGKVEFDGIERLTWNELFRAIGPVLLNEATDDQLRLTFQSWLKERTANQVAAETRGFSYIGSFKLSIDDFHTVKLQLRALGLISKSDRNRSVRDADTYWCLTPYGDEVLTRLRAIKRGDHGAAADSDACDLAN